MPGCARRTTRATRATAVQPACTWYYFWPERPRCFANTRALTGSPAHEPWWRSDARLRCCVPVAPCERSGPNKARLCVVLPGAGCRQVNA